MVEQIAANPNDLNAGTIKDDPSGISAPALVWHLAFWIRRSRNAEIQLHESDRENEKNDKHAFHLSICDALIDHLRRHGREPTSSWPLTDQQRDDVVRSMLPVSIAFKYPLKNATLKASIRLELHSEYLSITTIVELGDSDSTLELRRTLNATSEEVRQQASHFFQDFWKDFEGHVFPKSLSSTLDLEKGFADFRGMVLSDQPATSEYEKDLSEFKDPIAWGEQAKAQLLPALVGLNGDRFECATNYLLGGRALYMGALRPHSSSVRGSECDAVEFIVCALKSTTITRAQFGRLVGLITLLCTQRLCALKDALSLHEVSRQLSYLEEKTKRARQGIASNHEAIDRIQNAHEFFHQTTDRFLHDTNCGLLFRIEQSRFYVAQLEANLKLLDIRRLGSDQPIGDFISQRWGSEFDFINRLGKRLERTTSNFFALDQNYLIVNGNRLAQQTNYIDEETRKLFRVGDLALFLAIIPYYTTNLLELSVGQGALPTLTIFFWAVIGAFGIFRYLMDRLNSIVYRCVPFAKGRDFTGRRAKFGLSFFVGVLAVGASLVTEPSMKALSPWFDTLKGLIPHLHLS